MKIDKLDSTESWKRFLLENGNYALLTDFNNSKEKFEIKHNCENGKPYDVFPYVFKRGGGRCTFCNTKGFKKTTESVTIEFSKKNFKLLEPYKDTHTNIDFLCLTCNKIQNNSRNNVIKDICPVPLELISLSETEPFSIIFLSIEILAVVSSAL